MVHRTTSPHADVKMARWSPAFAAAPLGKNRPWASRWAGALGHVLNPQGLKDIEVAGVVGHELMAGLVRIVPAHLGLVPVVAGRLTVGFLLVLRPLLPSGRLALPFLALTPRLLDAGLLHGFQVMHLAVGGRERLGDAAVSAEGAGRTLSCGQVSQILGNPLRRRIGVGSGDRDGAIVRSKGQPPSPPSTDR